MSIAQQLEDRLMILADTKVKWVRGTPSKKGQSCLVIDYDKGHRSIPLSSSALTWLGNFISDYSREADPNGDDGCDTLLVAPIRGLENRKFTDPRASGFNDHLAHDRTEVLWALEEAIDQAKWEGV